MASASLNSGFQNLQDLEARQSFFQDAIERMANYWNDCKAVKTVKVSFLDGERETILKAITLAMDVTPIWPIVKNLMITFTPYMERRGHWDVWHNILSKAIDKAQLLNDIDGTTTLTALLARLCLRQSKNKESVQLSRKVISLARQSGNKFEEARVCSNLGFYYSNTGQWWRAEVLNCHALKIFEQLDNTHGLAHTHNHLGVLYFKQQNTKKAYKHLDIALKLSQELKDESFSSTVHGNLGLLYVSNPSEFKKAEYHLLTAIEKAKLSGSDATIGGHLISLAHTHRSSNSFDTALTYLKQSETLSKKLSDSLNLGKVWHNMGEVYFLQQDFPQGKGYLEKAVKIFEEINSGIYATNALDSLIEYAFKYNLESKHYIDKFHETVKRYGLEKHPNSEQTYKLIAKANLKS